jgi:hypothetical protein
VPDIPNALLVSGRTAILQSLPVLDFLVPNARDRDPNILDNRAPLLVASLFATGMALRPISIDESALSTDVGRDAGVAVSSAVFLIFGLTAGRRGWKTGAEVQVRGSFAVYAAVFGGETLGRRLVGLDMLA